MRRIRAGSLLAVVSLFASTACGGTWVDDPVNFKRVFDFNQPKDVKVLYSYYWKSPHWTVEYRYFIALECSRKFADGLTDPSLMTSISPDVSTIESCGGPRPGWFVPRALTHYEAWVPKSDDRYRVFRDKDDGTVFLCDQRL